MADPQPPVLGTPGIPGRRALVVGASSGVGAALVRQLVREGFAVAALARRGDKLQELVEACAGDAERFGGRVLVRVHDVTDTAAVPALFEELVRELGGLDLFVYTAGIMPAVARDEYDTDKDLAMLRVNFGGCVAWTNPVANLFRTQRSGIIVGVSSISGNRGRKGNPVYGASKAAMDCYLESLRNRLSESGVHVCTIKPGFVDTAMTAGMDGLFWVVSPAEAARRILAAARAGANVRYVSRRWGLVGLMVRLIPSSIFRKLNF